MNRHQDQQGQDQYEVHLKTSIQTYLQNSKHQIYTGKAL